MNKLNFKKISSGLLIATCTGLLSLFLSKFVPKLGAGTVSIFMGIFFGNTLFKKEEYQAGYKFAETNLLSYAIVLLGSTLSIPTLFSIGFNGFLLIVLQMAITILGVIYVGKKLNFSTNFCLLMASGNAVCGSSAIASTAPVIDADDSEKGISITIVNVIGILLMFLLPLIAKIVYELEPLKTSALIGSILQSVGQVIASGSMVSEEVKDFATIFKILRVILLVAVVFIFGYIKNKETSEIVEDEVSDIKNKKIKVPWYVIGFFVTCTLFSTGIISTTLSKNLKDISQYFEIIALSAIGLKVNILELIKQGKTITIYAVSIALIQISSALILIKIFL